MKLKYLPNILTIARMLCAIAMLTVQPLSVPFFLLFALCGMTDVADGYIARRFNACTQLGALLDSIADLIYIGVALYIFAPMLIACAPLIVWTLCIAAVRLASLVVGCIKYRKAAFLHTYLNKATGFALFLFPALLLVLSVDAAGAAICCIASLSSIEELIINLRSKTLNRNTKGLLFKTQD